MISAKVTFLLIFFVNLSLSQITLNSRDVESIIENYKSRNFSDPISVERIGDYIIGEGPVPPEDITWNPVTVDNIIMHKVCAANPAGNFQNPFNCNQFFMCAPPFVFLWECPAGGSYDPFPDLCVYPGSKEAQCPWHSAWIDNPDCTTIGQRLYWSPLTLPVEPEVPCGSKIRYCRLSQEVGSGECPEGHGYCKSYNACLPMEYCITLDKYFRLIAGSGDQSPGNYVLGH